MTTTVELSNYCKVIYCNWEQCMAMTGERHNRTSCRGVSADIIPNSELPEVMTESGCFNKRSFADGVGGLRYG